MTVARANMDRMMTLDEYQNASEELRIELIEGVVYDLAAPSVKHQMVSFELCRQLGNYLSGKKCRALSAPTAVYLDESKRRPTIVQPDILVICDPKKIRRDGCHGAPDLVMEVLSPANLKHDLVDKKRLYRKFGVKEYWVIYPDEGFVNVSCFDENGNELVETYTHEDAVKVGVLEDCVIDLGMVFPQETNE